MSDENIENLECVYLIQAPAFDNLNIFKYGKTTSVYTRFHTYPKNSKLLYLKRVVTCNYIEKKIHQRFTAFFKHEAKHGKEYFSGDIKSMKLHIDDVIKQSGQLINDKKEEDELIEKIKMKYKNHLKIDLYGNLENDDSKHDSENDDLENDDLENESENLDNNELLIKISLKKSNKECDTCGKVFTHGANYRYHINNKVCKPDEEKTDDKQYECKTCHKTFSTLSSMYRHVNHSCKISKKIEQERKEIYENLANTTVYKKIAEVEEASLKKIAAVEKANTKKLVAIEKANTKKIAELTNTIKQLEKQSITTDNKQTAELVGFGKEDLSKLKISKILNALKKGHNSIIELTKAVHFNSEHPEYHNIYISNMRDKYAMMYDGKKWLLTNRNELIDKIYEEKKSYIEDNLEKFDDLLSEQQVDSLRSWLDDDVDKVNEIKEEIKLLLYNSRDTINNAQCSVKSNVPSVKRAKAVKVVKNGE